MPATEAQIAANRANALKSTGPKTEEGKAHSRANSYKHGMTGAGVVMPEEDAAEVERLTRALRAELKPGGEVGLMLVRQMATLSVRIERSCRQETAAISERVRKVMDEFEAPEGVDEATAHKLRVEAGNIALFDAGKPACLARKYEAAAQRDFYRALNQLRKMKADARAAEVAPEAPSTRPKSASFSPAKAAERQLAEVHAELAREPLPRPSRPALPLDLSPSFGRVDVPISIGRRR